MPEPAGGVRPPHALPGRTRAGVVLVRGGRVAMIERVCGPDRYHVFPGGGVEPGETPEQAAVREAREELGLVVRLERLLAVVRRGGDQLFYLATEVGGDFGTGDGPEWGRSGGERGTYRAVWLPLGSLTQHGARPAALASLLDREIPDPTAPILTVDEP